MSDPNGNRPFPRAPLLGAVAVAALALISAGTVRIVGPGAAPAAAPGPVATRDLHFEDMRDGGIAVTDARDGRSVAVVAPGSGGFLRAALRGLARERKRQDLGAGPPFHLADWGDGRLTLEDTATGRSIELEAFGPDNAASFARLLDRSRAGTPHGSAP